MTRGQSNPLWERVLVSECHAVHLCVMHAHLRLQMYVCMHLYLYAQHAHVVMRNKGYLCACKRFRSHSSVCVQACVCIHACVPKRNHACAYASACSRMHMHVYTSAPMCDLVRCAPLHWCVLAHIIGLRQARVRCGYMQRVCARAGVRVRMQMCVYVCSHAQVFVLARMYP